MNESPPSEAWGARGVSASCAHQVTDAACSVSPWLGMQPWLPAHVTGGSLFAQRIHQNRRGSYLAGTLHHSRL